MICNYVSKIIPALQSRCTRFRFAPLTREAIEGRLRYIIDKEALTTRITDGAIKAIIILGNGDMRRILNVLQVRVLRLLLYIHALPRPLLFSCPSTGYMFQF